MAVSSRAADDVATCSVHALVKPDLVLEVAIAPAAALTRVSGAINRKRQRAFGIFKTQNEYLGHVGDGGFEIWERQQRAVHAFGSVVGQRGGTRIEVSFGLPMRTRALIAIFFGLYFVVAIGIALRPPETIVSIEELFVAIAGAAILAVIFIAAARRQRADLHTFVEQVFTDLPRL